jgi:snoRNA binding domain, fibrillarin
MIIQAIALLDTLDKDVNTFVMRVREWYGWHFPELVKIVPDNYQYSRVALLVQVRRLVLCLSAPGQHGTLHSIPRPDGASPMMPELCLSASALSIELSIHDPMEQWASMLGGAGVPV